MSELRVIGINYLYVALVIFAINLLPAFGPPTWAVLVFVKLQWNLNPVALILIGATMAVGGRTLLALMFRKLQIRMPRRLLENLNAARDLLERRRFGALALFAVFVASPLPSAPMFVAVGLLNLPLKIISLAFFFGRCLSYSLYVTLATLATSSVRHAATSVFGSTWAIVIQVVLLLAVSAIPLINWRAVGNRSKSLASDQIPPTES